MLPVTAVAVLFLTSAWMPADGAHHRRIRRDTLSEYYDHDRCISQLKTGQAYSKRFFSHDDQIQVITMKSNFQHHLAVLKTAKSMLRNKLVQNVVQIGLNARL